MSKPPSPADATRLERAAALLLADPLARHPGLAGPLASTAAALFGVDVLDLHNFAFVAGADPAWLAAPTWPSGCSVGGGIAAFFGFQGAKATPAEIQEHNRQIIHTVASITSEGSAAGYDSHGIVLSVLDLETGAVRLVRARTPGDIDERGHYTIEDLYRREPGLATGKSFIMVTGAQTRAATQGDNMYSPANAHLHYDWANRDPLDGALPAAELAALRQGLPTRLNQMGPFAVGHNGDINSKLKWERFFFAKGFYTDADADSKELPRIVRILWEALRADQLRGKGPTCLAWLVRELYRFKVLAERIGEEGRNLGPAQVEELVLATAAGLAAAGASLVAQACALAARLITWCDATSVYVFECLTDLSAREGCPLPATILVRGPKAGGMVLYEDAQDRTIPIKFASSLANLRRQIREFDDQKVEEIPVDYIATGAKVHVREGTVRYQALAEWQLAEIVPRADGTGPELRIYDIRKAVRLEPRVRVSPIIDYLLRGQRETVALKAEGEFADRPISQRTVTYDSVLGEILEGPPSLEGRQIKNFATEERPRYAVDNQYAAEILLSTVALQKNTASLFDYPRGGRGEVEGIAYPRPDVLFRQDEFLDRPRLRRILKKVRYVLGLGEGTSRNVAGIAASCANLEGLSDVILDARESNLFRTEAPHLDDATLVTFISNSGGTKPVVALADEIIARTGTELKNGPYVWSITNISTSELAQLSQKHLGASITNLPWEKAVGSTYAAFTAFQNLLTMLVYLHQVRGAIRPGRARYLYGEIASFPRVIERTLSFQAARDEVDRLARHVAGNAVDIAFVGALQGFDAAEAALKFAEMKQHSRVKFYSGAYEQHGQRATYLRHLHANPGTLVVLLVPNLETSIGSWMAQLIQEDKPRAGRIAVLCAEEDAQALKEAGADFVIPAPRGCTGSLFTDALTKMVLANMLTEATIRRGNEIAGKIRGWGKRLLDSSARFEAARIPELKDEIEVIRAQFHHLREGDFGAEERRRILVDTEKQLENEIIDLDGREAKLRQVYLESRKLSVVNPAQLDRVEDLLRTLLELEIRGEKDAAVFYNLLNDLILEFSDRSLAMRLAEERFADDAPRAKLAVHYQGLAKLVGANPIKPDNIAKFQQGWGIPSFLLPPGRRRSDPSGSLSDVARRFPDGSLGIDRAALLRLGFTAEEADIAEAFTALFACERPTLLKPQFNGGGRVKAFESETPVEHPYSFEETLLQQVLASGRSGLIAVPADAKFQLQLVAADRHGDISQGLLLTGELKAFANRAEMVAAVPSLARKVESLRPWLGVLGPDARESVLERIPLTDLLSLSERQLMGNLREIVEAQALADALPPKFREPFEFLGVDPARLSVGDLQTLGNVLHAVLSIKSGSIYRVQARWEGGQRKFWATRDTARLFGTAVGTHSSYDAGKEMRGIKLIAVVGGRLKMGYGRDGAHTVIIPIRGETGEVAHIVLFHLEVNEALPLPERIKTLGGKFPRIVNHASEYIEWADEHLMLVPMHALLMLSDEEIADDKIVPLVKARADGLPPPSSIPERKSASS